MSDDYDDDLDSETETGPPADRPAAKLSLVREVPRQIDIDLSNDAEAVKAITEAIQAGEFKRLARTENTLWILGGDPQSGPITYEECGPYNLMCELNQAPFFCFKRISKGTTSVQVAELTKVGVASTVLAKSSWSEKIPELKPNHGRWVLRAPNGTIELLTATLRPSLLTDMHTCEIKVAFDPEAGTDCPRFVALVKQVAPHECCREALLDSLAYCLTGSTAEQKFFWLQGARNSGKSTVWKVVMRLLGSYATEADKDLLFGTGKEHSANIVKLEGKRLVLQDELPRNAVVRTDVINRVTSSNTISAHAMRENYRDVRVSWKLAISSNEKPSKLGVSGDGIYRRMMLWFVKEAYTGPEIRAYENLVVSEEGPQILNLLVARLPGVKKNGIKACAHISGEVDWYETSADPLADFFREIIVRDDSANLCNVDLRQAWYQYTGERLSERDRKLGIAMHERGFEPTEAGKRWTKGDATRVHRGYRGVRVREGYLDTEMWTMK